MMISTQSDQNVEVTLKLALRGIAYPARHTDANETVLVVVGCGSARLIFGVLCCWAS